MKEVYKSIIELRRQVFTKIVRLAYSGDYQRIKLAIAIDGKCGIGKTTL